MINVPSNFRVIAIISAFNEEDVIVPVINHLFNEGVSVYLIDNWSTDRTFELVSPLSHCLTGIERWPKDGPSLTYDWEEILKRKEVLSQILNADWFMHYDADEIRESPWMGMKLRDAIYIVDQQGYNAIDFELLNFYPVDNNYQPGSSPAEYFKYFLFNDFIGDELQVKAWKNKTEPVNLSKYAGHLVEFTGRKVFPYKFIMRHYPIRSQQHGEKKVFSERKPRFNSLERKRNWHIQYDQFDEETKFLKDPADLLKFQPSFYDEFMIKQIMEREQIELEHKHRYFIAQRLAKGKTVLDVACGEGYGTALLSEVADQAIGVDTDGTIIAIAAKKYQGNNITFAVGSCSNIPLISCSIDLAVSFETIEHYYTHDQMIAEIARVLKPTGILILSTPAKKGCTDELYYDEWFALLSQHFQNIQVYGQRTKYGSLITPVDGTTKPAFRTIKKIKSGFHYIDGVERPEYFIAIAGNKDTISVFDTSLLEGNIDEPGGILPRDNLLSVYYNLLSMQRDTIRLLKDSATIHCNTIRKHEDTIRKHEDTALIHCNTIRKHEDTIWKHEDTIRRLKKFADANNDTISQLERTLKESQQLLTSLYASRSWRVTWPLRQIDGVVHKLRNSIVRDKGSLPEGFNCDLYLTLNPDVKNAGIDPKMHYLCYGRHEGRTFSLPNISYHGSQEFNGESTVLPEGFNCDLYLALNPDIKNAVIDPKMHYLLYGRHEGRMFSLPNISYHEGQEFNIDLPTILIVCHEASRTGAPVLSLNLVETFVTKYNVVALLLDDGPLTDAFLLTGATVVSSPNLRRNSRAVYLCVSKLCEQFNFKFALINSIESRFVLPALGNYFVPSISLFHEFASYTRPRNAFREALFWSGEAVFSTNITKESALAEYPDLAGQFAHILPQGRCLLPSGKIFDQQFETESERIRRLIRPKNFADDTVVVLGAGTVQLRKGVDLFIECAARVVSTPQGAKCRFVWIGKGYDPDNDLGYSVYLSDQIRRAGLQEHVFFIDETTAIETAYEEADLFLLSSRLDPLPNVAIDAMAYGVPVLCFNKSSGIADFLIDIGLQNHCVADYLDSTDLSAKILALAGSPVLLKDVADRCREASGTCFSMKDYVARLDILAQGVCDRTQQEKADVLVILESGMFRRDFSCLPHHEGLAIEEEVRTYVRAWASGIDRRKPFPGFHPGIYLEQNRVTTKGADPFAEYLRAGQPDGPWNYQVIEAGETSEEDLPANQRVALHLHAYYPELLPELTSRLARNRIRPDLFVSVANKESRELVISQLKDYKGKVVDVQLVPNRGRDIGPFLTAFGQRILAHYDFVGHIHTKKSVDVADAAFGANWYRFLSENLLGSELSGARADYILAKMKDDASIGMVFPDDPYVIGWSSNLSFAEPLAERLGLQKLPEFFNFPVGTMFWARTSALAPLMNLKLDWNDYPDEPLPYDGTVLHAIERLFSLTLSINNFRSAATNLVGLTR